MKLVGLWPFSVILDKISSFYMIIMCFVMETKFWDVPILC